MARPENGARNCDVQIVKRLIDGERVVAAGTFLLDSETNIRTR